jgi:hypothetical protein
MMTRGAVRTPLRCIFIRFVPLRCALGARGYPHTEHVPRETPPVGAFEVTLGALHLGSNDTNALARGWGVPQA